MIIRLRGGFLLLKARISIVNHGLRKYSVHRDRNIKEVHDLHGERSGALLHGMIGARK